MAASLPPSFFSGHSPIALVAGGAGFVGSRLCEELIEKNVRVICVDNWQTGVRQNVSKILHNPSFQILEHDITKEFLHSFPRLDYIIDAAGVEAYLNGEDVSIDTLDTNSSGVKLLLELTKRTGAKFLLVSTVDIESGSISSSSLSSYFGGTRAKEGLFSHREAKRFAEALVAEYQQKENIDARVVRLGDVYGPRMMMSTGGSLSRVLKPAVYQESIRLPQQQVFVYPTFIDDAVWGIIKSLFSPGTRGSIISLAGERTSLSRVVDAIVSLRPYTRRELGMGEAFVGEDPISDEFITQGRSLISWEPHTTLLEGLASTLEWLMLHKHTVSHVSTKTQGKYMNVSSLESEPTSPLWHAENEHIASLGETNKEKLESKKKLPPVFETTELVAHFDRKKLTSFITSLGIVLLLFAGFCLFPLVEFLFGVANLKIATENNKRSGVGNVVMWVDNAHFWFSHAENGFFRWEALPGLKGQALIFAQRSRVLAQTGDVVKEKAEVQKNAHALLDKIFGEESFPLAKYAQDLSVQSSALDSNLGFLEADMQKDKMLSAWVSSFLHVEPAELSIFRRHLRATTKLLAYMQNLLGGEGKKTYLVLIQDNTHTRPGGGVVAAYGFLTLDKGRLVSHEFFPTVVADSQLAGHVDPPEPLRKYGKQDAWLLKDAMWSSDFPTSARRASWFIDKELGQTVDGVIGVDFEYLKQAIGRIGHLAVEGVGDVTQDNFNQLVIQQKSQKQEEISAGVANALFEKVIANTDDKDKIMNVTLQGLDTKHVSLFTNNSDANNSLSEIGWNGEVSESECGNEECMADYLAFSEAALGEKDSNLLVERSFSLDTFFQETTVLHKFTVSLKSKQEGYESYFKLLIPSSSLNPRGVLVSTEGIDDIALEMGSELKKTAVGGRISIPAQGEQQLVFSWEMPMQTGTYTLLWQKQLGSMNNPFWLTFNNPGFRPTEVTPMPSLTDSGSIGYNSSLSRDFQVRIKWQK